MWCWWNNHFSVNCPIAITKGVSSVCSSTCCWNTSGKATVALCAAVATTLLEPTDKGATVGEAMQGEIRTGWQWGRERQISSGKGWNWWRWRWPNPNPFPKGQTHADQCKLFPSLPLGRWMNVSLFKGGVLHPTLIGCRMSCLGAPASAEGECVRLGSKKASYIHDCGNSWSTMKTLIGTATIKEASFEQVSEI